MNKKYFRIFFILIILINALIYYPALSHPGRSDQIVYLTETAGQTNFFEIIQNTYSYNRTRTFMPGDDFLFRPLFFTVLAAEKSLWGYDFRLWQMTGIALHVLVIFLLLKVLLYIRRDWTAWLWALHFSALFTTMEMVIWHHVHGYLVFTALLLFALLSYFQYRDRQEENNRKLLLMILSLTAACFIFEYGLILSAVLAFVMFLKNRDTNPKASRTKSAILLIPIFTFFALNLFDLYLQTPAKAPPTAGNPFLLFQTFISSLSTLTLLPLLSAFTHLHLDERTQFTLSTQWSHLNLGLDPFLSKANWLVLAGPAILCGVWSYFRIKSAHSAGPKIEKNVFFNFILMAVLLGLYTFFVVDLRRSLSNFHYLNHSMYHFYIPWIFLTIGGYCLFIMANTLLNRGRNIFVLLLAFFLILNTALNAQKVYSYNQLVKRDHLWWGQLTQKLGDFVRQHQDEEDFSFAWVYRYRGGSKIILKTAKGDVRGFDLDLMFHPYINNKNPKYYLVYPSNEQLVVFTSSAETKEFLKSKGLIPEK